LNNTIIISLKVRKRLKQLKNLSVFNAEQKPEVETWKNQDLKATDIRQSTDAVNCIPA
jgi:hypothetical protein